jgi:hypothetical protein
MLAEVNEHLGVALTCLLHLQIAELVAAGFTTTVKSLTKLWFSQAPTNSIQRNAECRGDASLSIETRGQSANLIRRDRNAFRMKATRLLGTPSLLSQSAINRARHVYLNCERALREAQAAALFPDGTKPIQYGLIGEEVADVFPDLVARSADGQIESVKYQVLDSMLLNELQRQQRVIEQQQLEIESLKAQLNEVSELRSRLVALENALVGNR